MSISKKECILRIEVSRKEVNMKFLESKFPPKFAIVWLVIFPSVQDQKCSD